MRDELLRDPEHPQEGRRCGAGGPLGEPHCEGRADAALRDAVLHGDHRARGCGEIEQRLLQRQGAHGVQDDDVRAVLAGPALPLLRIAVRHGPGGVDRTVRERADGHDQHVDLGGGIPAEHVTGRMRLLRGQRRGAGALGEAHDRGAGGAQRCRHGLGEPFAVARCPQREPGHLRGDREVPDAVVAGAVVTGHARSVERERDILPVEGDVQQQLVEGTVEEGRVEADHGAGAPVGEPCSGVHGELLGDADVEHPLGQRALHRRETDRIDHRRADRHDPLVLLGGLEQRRAQPGGPGGRRRGLVRRWRHRIVGPGGCLEREGAGGVPVVHGIGLGPLEAGPLAGDDMDDDPGAGRILRRLARFVEGLRERGEVVPVDRAQVGQSEPAEQVGLGVGAAPGSRPVDLAAGSSATRAQVAQVAREPSDRRGVGAGVVVEHHHGARAEVRAQVVERLEAHAPGQRPVPGDGDGDGRLAAETMGPLDAVSPRDRSGGMGVLDHVVRGFAPVRVAGGPAGAAQPLEVGAAGEHLVDVRLMAGVEDDRLAGRVELAVQRDRQLHDPEVGAQVPTGARGDLDQAAPQGAGEAREVRRGKRAQSRRISGDPDLVGDVSRGVHDVRLSRRHVRSSSAQGLGPAQRTTF